MLADFRFAFRGLVNTPGFTAHALLTLVLGFGSLATLLAIVRGLQGADREALHAPVRMLAGIAGLLLLLAGANVTVLLLARVDTRQRELAIRRAIGAGRRRLMALFFAEGLVLAVLGAAGGLLAGAWAVNWAVAAGAPGSLRGLPGVDRMVTALVFVLACPVAFVISILPARRAAETDAHDVLRDSVPAGALLPSPPRRPGAMLVGGEVTLSALLAVAWLSSRAADALAGATQLVTTLLGICAAASVALTTLGIWVVTTYDLGRRSRELGVRLALGARSGDVIRIAVRGAMQAVVAGLAIGLVASLGVHRKLQSLQVGSEPATLATLALVGLGLTAVALAATSLPARRAVRGLPAPPVRSA